MQGQAKRGGAASDITAGAKQYSLVDANFSDGGISLMDDDGSMRDDVRVTDKSLLKQLAHALARGADVAVTVNAAGEILRWSDS